MFTRQTLLIAGFLWVGCVTAPPQPLVDARTAYERTSQTAVARLTPRELDEARMALDTANSAYEAYGDSAEVRDYAHLALQRIEVAEAKARAKAAQGKKSTRVTVRTNNEALNAAQQQLALEKQKSAKTEAELEAERLARLEAEARAAAAGRTAEELELERQKRLAAEAKLHDTMTKLAEVAAVKEEARGLVITLSGSVLFASNKSALLEPAQHSLDQVAEALVAQTDDKRIVVEGHTDSTGSDELNDPLSRRRAQAVRDYLITRGVDPYKITAVGLGSSRPLVDNTTAENRANNRRVEIIIAPPSVSVR